MADAGIESNNKNDGADQPPKSVPVVPATPEAVSVPATTLLRTMEDTEDNSPAKKRGNPDPQFEAWAAAEKARYAQLLEKEQDEGNKEKIKRILQEQDAATQKLRDYIKNGGMSMSMSKDQKILYVASDEDNKKWLQLKMVFDPETRQQTEFIGIRRGFGTHKNLTEKDALAIIDLAKLKGWQSVKLHGSQDEKSLLWLAAQRRGMAVNMTGFIPSPEYVAHWEKDKALRAQIDASKAPVGVTPSESKFADTPKPSEQKPVAPVADTAQVAAPKVVQKTIIAQPFKSPTTDALKIKASRPFKIPAENSLKAKMEQPFKTPDPAKSAVRPALPVKKQSPKL